MGLFDLFSKKPKDSKPINNNSSAKRPVILYDIPSSTSHEFWGGTDSNSDFSICNFLNYVNAKPLGENNDSYARKVATLYGIHNPLKKHRELIDNGYLKLGSKYDCLNNMKTQQLKDILKSNELSVTGSKAALIQRIVDNIDLNTLHFQTIYVLSEKGTLYINQFIYYIEVEKYLHDGIFSLEEFEEEKKLTPNRSTKDIVWSIYNKKSINYFKNYNQSFLRNLELCRYNLLISEKRDKEALLHVLTVLYYDINMPYNDITELCIAPGIIKYIQKLASDYTDSIVDEIYKTYVPMVVFSCDTFKKIVSDIILGKKIDLSKYSTLS